MEDFLSVNVEIPVEIIHVNYRVDVKNPLSIPIQGISKNFEGGSTSLSRLAGISRFSERKNEVRSFNEQTIVVRDLWQGEFWSPRVLSDSLPSEKGGRRHRIKESVDRMPETVGGMSSEIVSPNLGRLAWKTKIERDRLMPITIVEKIEVGPEIKYVNAEIGLVEDNVGNKRWVHYEGPMVSLVGENISDIEQFRPILAEVADKKESWPLAPEVEALRRLRNARKEEKVDVAKKIARHIIQQIENDSRPRLDFVKPVVGSCMDMWLAAQEVINSAESSVFILSSFTNMERVTSVRDRILEAIQDSRVKEILISIGEPDRKSDPNSSSRSEAFIDELAGILSPSVEIKGGLSPIPNHSKVIISDSGMALLCSCNLLNSSQDGFQLESGLIIDDARFSSSLLQQLFDENWVAETISREASKIGDSLDSRIYPETDLSLIKEKIAKTRKNLEVSKKSRFALIALDVQLQKIAERPIWQILRTLDHRPMLVDCISNFEKRLVLASDGLRSSGLDKSLMNKIVRRAKTVSGRNGKPIIQLWWGRHRPGSKTQDDADKIGRKEASERLAFLRDESPGNYQFHPAKSNEPMGTHAKLFAVDDMRLVVTSDNTLSFGDDVMERGDAGELGILIDHPRLARQVRGSMELWLPAAREKKDLTRWGALIAEEISHNTLNHHTIVQLDPVLIEAINRINRIPMLKKDWRSIFLDSKPEDIVQKISDDSWNNGGIIGLFHAQGPGTRNYRKLEVRGASVTLAGNPIWREHTLDERIEWDRTLIESGFFSEPRHGRIPCQKCGKPVCSNGNKCEFLKRGKCRYCHCD